MEEIQDAGIGTRIQHPKYGMGVITGVRAATWVITFVDYGSFEMQRQDPLLEIVHLESINPEIETLSEHERSLLEILRMWNGMGELVPLGDKWKGGKMVLIPGQAGLQQKEIPVEVFFHKIVMLRDRLRVMEQQINAHAVLSDEEKINLQQYITRIYGTLTTFNVLFKLKEQQFAGEKGKETE